MNEFINYGLLLVIIVLLVIQEYEKQGWRRERAQLLDRVMAKTLPEYVEAQASQQPIRVVTVEDLKREIAPPREEGLEVG
jgi:hypothetical protein